MDPIGTPSSSEPAREPAFVCLRRNDGDVVILHHGRPASTLRGAPAREFLARLDGGSLAQQQALMARATGNYRRGNERTAAAHPRNRR